MATRWDCSASRSQRIPGNTTISRKAFRLSAEYAVNRPPTTDTDTVHPRIRTDRWRRDDDPDDSDPDDSEPDDSDPANPDDACWNRGRLLVCR